MEENTSPRLVGSRKEGCLKKALPELTAEEKKLEKENSRQKTQHMFAWRGKNMTSRACTVARPGWVQVWRWEVERDALQWGEPDPGKDKSSALTCDFDSNTKPNHHLSVTKHVASVCYMPALCSELFTSEQDKLAGWGEKGSDYERGSGEASKSARSCACGPAIREGQRISRS